MKNRPQLRALTQDLENVDDAVLSIERSVPSITARAHLGKARAMLRAAKALVENALRVETLDGSDALDAAMPETVQ